MAASSGSPASMGRPVGPSSVDSHSCATERHVRAGEGAREGGAGGVPRGNAGTSSGDGGSIGLSPSRRNG